MLEIAFAQATLPTAGALVLFALEGETPDMLEAVDGATGGAVSRGLAAAEWKGKAGQVTTVLAPGGGLSRVVAVGLGKEPTAHAVEEAGGHAVAALGRDAAAGFAAGGLEATLAAHAALGAVLRAYRFDRYRTQEKPEDKPKLAKVIVLTPDPKAARAAWAPLKAIAEGVFLTRDLVTEPPNVLNPATFAERCRSLEALGVEVEILGPKELAAEKFGALLGVSQGSVNEPRMVVMRWNGGAPKPKPSRGRKAAAPEAGSGPLAFIGKGVTFDSGGISIKPAGGMEDMKWDMAGAGAVVGAMAALAGRKARVDVVGLIGLVENMPSGTAQRPGDVVTTASGQTVEIINTDAEGRMVLADVIHYAGKRFEPKLMVDLATLTGAMIVALGHEMGGMFANDDALAAALTAAGVETAEKLWRLPMGEAYDKQLKSDIADMKHVTGRPGSAITAAQFIGRFVGSRPWAHLDVAGVVWSTKDAACIPKGATAFGVRLLDRLAASYES